ncbi:MAG TPA: hypothetical protein VF894_00105 [Anaeromyxobacter sp.]
MRERHTPSARTPTAKDVERELARARSARRLLPWAVLTAAGGGALAVAAGGGARGAVALAAVGLVFALFVWTTSIARCPACGARLRQTRRPGSRGVAGPAEVLRIESCARCRARFE